MSHQKMCGDFISTFGKMTKLKNDQPINFANAKKPDSITPK